MSDSPVARVLLSPLGRAAVVAGDTGKIIRLARQALCWSQQELADRAGYSQPTISRLERGMSRAVRDTAVLADLAATLGVPAVALGVVHTPGGPSTLDDVDRRELLGGTIALAVAAMLPQSVATPGRIGATEAAQCWTGLRRLFELDDHQGGNAVYEMAAGMARQLQGALRRGSYTPSVAKDFHLVTAATMEHAGWCAYDAGRQDTARRWWLETCHLADLAGVPEARVTALASMSLQAGTRPGCPHDAVDLARAAKAAAGDHASPLLLSLLAAREAVGHAQAHNTVAATAAIAQARRWLDHGRRGDEPLWLSFWNSADLAWHETHVSLATGRAASAEASARAALASADAATFPRNHTIYTVRLGSVLTHLGQLDEAIAVTGDAVQRARALRGSRRVTIDLHSTVDALARQNYAPAQAFASAARRLLPAA